MKRNVTHENFERFLKESADDLQMRPTEDVWRRIEGRMNGRRRWVFFTSVFFLLTASLFGYLIIDQSKQPSDPFAGVRTIEKPHTSGIDAGTQHPSPSNTAAQRTPAAQQPPVASLTHAASPIHRQPGGQLFQKPILNSDGLGTAGVTLPETFTPTVVDEHEPVSSTAAPAQTHPTSLVSEVPGIEDVTNAYKPLPKKRKSEFQLYFTPTVSYRRLTENKSYLRAVPQNLATFNLAALYDVNSMVTHKPDLGLELGFAFKFPVSNRIKLRTGMQFNINRYDIKAFTYVPERTTIALNTPSRGVDSVNTMSSYRNFNGGRADWLQNFYFQVSTPLGVEVALSNSKKTRFGVATTIQPTYVLGDRAYLISTNYKNYSQVPWLTRRWNVNTSLETFVSYSTGTLRWQVGPQVRYQLLSSFVEQYPVKENLFDFGMKVGVSLDRK